MKKVKLETLDLPEKCGSRAIKWSPTLEEHRSLKVGEALIAGLSEGIDLLRLKSNIRSTMTQRELRKAVPFKVHVRILTDRTGVAICRYPENTKGEDG